MPFEKMSLTEDQASEFQMEYSSEGTSDWVVLSGGEWSQAFAFKQGGKDFVARFNPSQDDFLNDRYADRFSSRRLPIPKIVELGRAFGGYYAISERAFGTMIDHLDKPGMERIIPSLFATLDAIREVDVSSSTGFGMWDSEGNGTETSWEDVLLGISSDSPDSRIYGWRKELTASPVSDVPFQRAYEVLVDLAKDIPDNRSLIHNDLMNFNVLTNNDEVVAVFDWGNAKYGDFLYDLAMFTFWGPIHEPIKGIDWEAVAKQHYEKIGLEVPEFERRLQCCMIHIGLDAQAYYGFKHDTEWLIPVTSRTLEVAKYTH